MMFDIYLLPLIGAALSILYGYLLFQKFSKPKTPSDYSTILVHLKPQSHQDFPSTSDNPSITPIKDELPPPPLSSERRLTIFYYSQSGTAIEYSKMLLWDADKYGLLAKIVDVEEYHQRSDAFFQDCHDMVLFVVSSYGSGDPPNHAIQFNDWIMSNRRDEEVELFSNIKFSVFGLGDRTYKNYNKVAKVLDKRLKYLGCQPIHDVGLGDADSSLEDDFLIWKKGWWIEAKRQFNLGEPRHEFKLKRMTLMKIHSCPSLDQISAESSSNIDSGDVVDSPVNSSHSLANQHDLQWHKVQRWSYPPSSQSPPFNHDKPYLARILVNRELHDPESERSCRHIEIKLHQYMQYQPGDHLMLFPLNSIQVALQLTKYLQVNPEQIISIHSVSNPEKVLLEPCTILAALRSYYDIQSRPHKTILQLLAHYDADPLEKARLNILSSDEPDEHKEYKEYIINGKLNIVDVMEEFPNARPPLDEFLELLPKLQPRSYSISSSNLTFPGHLHITVIALNFQKQNGKIQTGVASAWLSSPEAIPTDEYQPVVPIFISASTFRLPPSPESPMILVGPGTGLAPFRGFIQERLHRHLKLKGQPITASTDALTNVFLFYGCRNPKHDYIYQEELEMYQNQHQLALNVAFSRQPSKEKVYVQDLMTKPEMSKKLYQLLQEAYVFICGDAKTTVKSVTTALLEIIAKEGDKSSVGAKAFIKRMKKKGRFRRDYWK